MNVKPKSVLVELDQGLLGLVDAEAAACSQTRVAMIRLLIRVGLATSAQARGEEVPEAVQWRPEIDPGAFEVMGVPEEAIIPASPPTESWVRPAISSEETDALWEQISAKPLISDPLAGVLEQTLIHDFKSILIDSRDLNGPQEGMELVPLPFAIPTPVALINPSEVAPPVALINPSEVYPYISSPPHKANTTADRVATVLARPVRTAHETLTSGDHQTLGEQRLENLTKGQK